MSTSIDPSLLKVIASDLGVDPSFIEKDWYAMRIIGALITVSNFGIQLIFSGGTSLSKGFGLIKRFSEDLDFKVILPVSSPSRKQLSTYRSQILEVIRKSSSDWSFNEKEVKPCNENRQFSCNISYQPIFEQSIALRPEIKLDINFISPFLDVEEKTLTSFISQAMKQPPES